MFTAATYVARRRVLLQHLDGERGLVLLPANGYAPMQYAGNPYPYVQDTTFRYYCGLDRAGLALVVDLDAGHATLYGEDAGPDEITWTGPQPRLDELALHAGIDETGSLDDLAELLGSGRTVHLLPPYRAAQRLRLAGWLGVAPDEVDEHVSHPLRMAVIEQRSIKDDDEVAAIEEAVATARDMHLLAMRSARAGVVEREVMGAVAGVAFAEGGRPSFGIIFSRDGQTLHNEGYNNTLENGDLALLDCGALAATGYCSDVTRVTPVGGRFSDRQRDVYETVLQAQLDAIEAMRPGVPFRDVHLLAARRMTEGLVDLGLMQGDPEEAVAAGAHALFFPHGLGHQMGLEVHDMEGLGEDFVGYDDEIRRSEQFGLAYLRLGRRLQPGFVVTVEPGLYVIPELIDRWQAERRHEAFIRYDALDAWRDFGGIRIEDDVLVTDDGHRVLGPEIPKQVIDVEALASE